MNDVYIETERLFLTKLLLTDAEIVFQYRSDKRVSFYHTFHPQSIEDVIAFIENNTKTFNNENTWFQLGIHLKDERLIGDIGTLLSG